MTKDQQLTYENTHDHHGMAPPPNFNVQTDSNYHYIPTKSACIIFFILFGVSGLIHAFQAFYFRMRWLLATAFLACVGETVGWAARYWSSLTYGTPQTPFTMQICTTIIAPTFLLAVYFTLLGRIILTLGPQYSRLSPRLYFRIFLTIDIVCLVVQALGGGWASGASDPRPGADMMLGGIILQLVALVTFNILGAEFLWRFHNERPIRDAQPYTPASSSNTISPKINAEKGSPRFNYSSKRLQALVIGVVISNICLIIRGIYRTAELADGFNGRIISTEIYFILFDGAMVAVATLALNIMHPGYLLPREILDAKY
ncbi:RTA1-domain-containing protein [Rickenella mellea]|uniref:RTA1-domain-containing protein n=1 Tax=Rickenella mellea TaxID=50990 RepID=A0A4Y7PLB9_9AGAM|nr:RTA1-domain-containing protein [Rickenella mellea]